MGVTYLDFDLLVERSGDGYRSRVIQSPGGQASATFSPPFSQVEVENLVLKVSRSIGQRNVRRVESSELKNVQTFGSRLFDSVFDGDVRACLRSSIDEASRQDAGLRIRLRLGDVPELIDLPWEYLYNSSLNRFIARQLETPVVRYLDLSESIRPLTVQPPVRVLVMISSPTDYPQLDVEHEWSKLRDSLSDLEGRGLVSLERQDDATLPALLQRLRRGQHHVFHFVGHGGFDESMNDGVLVLEDESGKGDLVSGSHLGEMLRGSRPMRLAVLNACEGARNGTTDPFAGAAQSMVQQGIPAVIANQFEITDGAAIVLAQAFYSALADGYPVDAALGEARRAIFASGNELEWATPVLYMRSPDGKIFDITDPVHTEPAVVIPDVVPEVSPVEQPTLVPEMVLEHATLSPDVPIVDIPLAHDVPIVKTPAEPIEAPPRRDTSGSPSRPDDVNGGGGKRPRPRWIWYAVGALILVVGSTLFWAFGQGGGGGDLTTLISGPELSKSSATFQVSGSDGVTFRCQLDGDPEQVCETGATFSGLADGQHELKAWAVDASGNAGEADTWTWTVDETPPEITLDGPEGATTETSATIHISINEPVESWICKLNSDPVPCTTTIATLTDLPARQQIFRVHATDLAGNEAETERWDWEVVAGTTVPTNTVLPSFTCSDTTCDALPGSWDGNPTGYEYFWLQNCNAAGTPADCHETPITGQQVGVLCGYVRLGVIAKSAAGDSAPAFSDPQQYIPECIE